MDPITELPLDAGAARVYEHGWQSWSPSTVYRVGEPPLRATSRRRRIICYRPEAEVPADAYQGEGLLAVQPSADGPVHVFAVQDGRGAIPSIRAEVRGDRLAISADGAVQRVQDSGSGGIDGALARWADEFADRMGVTAMRRAPVGWCSWYHYFQHVTQADMDENLEQIERLGLPVEVVQLDDGYEAEIGDWLLLSE